MRAGTLRHRLTIQKPTAGTANNYGEQVDTWSEQDIVWGEVETLQGYERERANQVHPEASVKITIRYYGDLTTAMRFKWGTRYFAIVDIVPDPRAFQMVCLCVEEV